MTAWRPEGPVTSLPALLAGMRDMLDTARSMAADGAHVHAVACWQDATSVVDQLPLLEALTEVASVTVACSGRPPLPADAVQVELDAGEDLVDEFSLLLSSAGGGAVLVGHELGTTLPAPTVEAGRAFRWECSHARYTAVAHGRRLLRELGARLDPAASAGLQASVAAMARVETNDVLDREGELVASVEVRDDQRQPRVAPGCAQGGLATLDAWLVDAGPRSPDLGLVVVRSDVRGVAEVLRALAEQPGRVGDLVVAVPPDAALLVLPGLTGGALQQRLGTVVAELNEALATHDVTGTCARVPAVRARRDLVGTLGHLLADLRVPVAA